MSKLRRYPCIGLRYLRPFNHDKDANIRGARGSPTMI